MKAIVIYYSLEGNTRLVADTISKTLNCPKVELITEKEYASSGFKKFFWGGKSVLFKEKPALKPLNIDLKEYDTILIGTPIWVGTFAPPFNTFLAEHKIENKNIGLFACHGGGGTTKFHNQIKALLPNNNFIGNIDFIDPLEKDKDTAVKKAKEWAENIIKNLK